MLIFHVYNCRESLGYKQLNYDYSLHLQKKNFYAGNLNLMDVIILASFDTIEKKY